jgi:alpha/beta superfamily hydrolase
MNDTKAEARPVALEGPAGRLDAVWHDPFAGSPSRFAAVVAHPHPLYGGTKENAVVLATTEALCRAGGGVLRFDFRGVGRSAGSHDGGAGELGDLRAAVRAAVELAPGLPLLVAGYSFGAVMALRLLSAGAAADRGDGAPAGVLAIAPPIGHYDFSFLATNATPLVVVCGEEDALTPRGDLDRHSSSWGGKLAVHWLAGAGHDLGAYSRPEELRRTLEEAIDVLVRAALPATKDRENPRMTNGR